MLEVEKASIIEETWKFLPFTVCFQNKWFGNCFSTFSEKGLACVNIWPMLRMCCNSQITCSVITRIAAIHWKQEAAVTCSVSKVRSDNSYSLDLWDVKFEFWPVYINHIYVFIGIHTCKQTIYGLDNRTELTLRPAHISNVLSVFILLFHEQCDWNSKNLNNAPPTNQTFFQKCFEAA